ncbi:efflux transporter outer membrane subunit [Hirschia baltica]|uniref:RND efflux system, outer membrane lipoprotein, NodT family n=1 Tax=Hirschia baltica (strain ATCC 49814 / DSM 5838 / IFAM 1418) TaxID=582402 RepID=C6XNT1_HIRBI|nr:efflux transporter outer membrane subunit [Hirschia baltica]ACT58334.1 RND efflux system, outer membrane lipoprotein, NodT family [Hirschia baltica ATCC 49814]
MKHHALSAPLMLVLSTLTLSGCASMTSAEDVSMATRTSIPQLDDSWAGVAARVGEVEMGWLEKLNDPTLTALVDEAIANNKNLEAAAAGVERSWALAGQAGAGLSPMVNIGASGGGGGALDGASVAALGTELTAAWEVDLWGRIQAGVNAATLGAQATQADYTYSQYSLAAAVAQAYFLTIEAGLQADVTAKSLKALTETTRIVDVQYEAGLASSQDLALAKSDLASTQASLIAAQGAQRSAMRALEVVLGRYPAADLDIIKGLPSVPELPPAGTPSDLLERRPDIIAAERNVAASFESLHMAKVANLPSISLIGSVDGASSDLADILNPANVAWQAVTSIAAPLIDGGRNEAEILQASAEQKQAIAVYGQTALDAFSEVEEALDQNVVLKQRVAALRESADKAEEALRIANLRYNEGETSLIDVLTIQQRVFQADANLVNVQQLRLSQWVKLNLALGGSW